MKPYDLSSLFPFKIQFHKQHHKNQYNLFLAAFKPLKEAMVLRDWLPLGLRAVMKSLNFNFVFMMNAKSFCISINSCIGIAIIISNTTTSDDKTLQTWAPQRLEYIFQDIVTNLPSICLLTHNRILGTSLVAQNYFKNCFKSLLINFNRNWGYIDWNCNCCIDKIELQHYGRDFVCLHVVLACLFFACSSEFIIVPKKFDRSVFLWSI